MAKRYVYFSIKKYPNWKALVASVLETYPEATNIGVCGGSCPSGGRNCYSSLKRVGDKYELAVNFRSKIMTGISKEKAQKLGKMSLLKAVNTVYEFTCKRDGYNLNEELAEGALRVLVNK